VGVGATIEQRIRRGGEIEGKVRDLGELSQRRGPRRVEHAREQLRERGLLYVGKLGGELRLAPSPARRQRHLVQHRGGGEPRALVARELRREPLGEQHRER